MTSEQRSSSPLALFLSPRNKHFVPKSRLTTPQSSPPAVFERPLVLPSPARFAAKPSRSPFFSQPDAVPSQSNSATALPPPDPAIVDQNQERVTQTSFDLLYQRADRLQSTNEDLERQCVLLQSRLRSTAADRNRMEATLSSADDELQTGRAQLLFLRTQLQEKSGRIQELEERHAADTGQRGRLCEGCGLDDGQREQRERDSQQLAVSAQAAYDSAFQWESHSAALKKHFEAALQEQQRAATDERRRRVLNEERLEARIQLWQKRWERSGALAALRRAFCGLRCSTRLSTASRLLPLPPPLLLALSPERSAADRARFLLQLALLQAALWLLLLAAITARPGRPCEL